MCSFPIAISCDSGIFQKTAKGLSKMYIWTHWRFPLLLEAAAAFWNRPLAELRRWGYCVKLLSRAAVIAAVARMTNSLRICEGHKFNVK